MRLGIASARLRAQRLSGRGLAAAEDAVRWLGAVQAQEYADAKWALALRTRDQDEAAIERAFAAGRLLRTHVLRPTWHFVTPADIRWMLALTGPRVSAANASYNRRLGLDAGVFRRSQRAIAKALRGGAQLTRQELKTVLQRAGVDPGGVQRLAHIVMQAELDAVICSGARRGRQFTYALLDERVPPAPARSRDDALAELARRYFVSRGPAQLQDFRWWSGLIAADARAAVEMAAADLVQDDVDGRTYWRSPAAPALRRRPPAAYLLPQYDEYLIAYKDRSASIDPAGWAPLARRDPFIAPVVIGGQVVAGWRRRPGPNGMTIRITPCAPLGAAARRAIAAAARAYTDFQGGRDDDAPSRRRRGGGVLLQVHRPGDVG